MQIPWLFVSDRFIDQGVQFALASMALMASCSSREMLISPTRHILVFDY